MTLPQEIRKKWKPRSKKSHKGDFGRLLIVAGSKGYTGAAYLASVAAMRTGAGLVTLAVPEKVYTVLARRSSDVMVRSFPSNQAGSFSSQALRGLKALAKTQDVLAVGPGLSQNKETQKLIRSFVTSTSMPLVLDADGLNAFAGYTQLLKKRKGDVILTPHPGEFVRLFKGTRLTSATSGRKTRALAAAKSSKTTLLLKGHQTVVSDASGKTYVNKTGNPGMAKGGSGDVLTGMIAALIGQGFSTWDSARFGAYLHGLAGDKLAKKKGEASILASELPDMLPEIIKRARRI